MRYLCFTLLFLFSVNSTAVDLCPNKNSESLLQDYLYDIRLPFLALQYFNLNQPEEARKSLAKDLSNIIYGLNQLLPYEGCFENEAERDRAWSLVRVLAVMHERYPVPEWKNDRLVLSFLEKSKEMNPAQTAKIRGRDWSKLQ